MILFSLDLDFCNSIYGKLVSKGQIVRIVKSVHVIPNMIELALEINIEVVDYCLRFKTR